MGMGGDGGDGGGGQGPMDAAATEALLTQLLQQVCHRRCLMVGRCVTDVAGLLAGVSQMLLGCWQVCHRRCLMVGRCVTDVA